MAYMEDIGAYIKAVTGFVNASQVGSGSTEILDAKTGVQLDLRTLKKFHSATIVATAYIFYNTSGVVFTGKADLQDRASTTGVGSTWANFGTTGQTFTLTNATTTTGATGWVTGQMNIGKSLRMARRYIRVKMEGTSTKGWFATTATGNLLNISSVLILGGAQSKPATSTSASE
jgi:hypothetical protein